MFSPSNAKSTEGNKFMKKATIRKKPSPAKNITSVKPEKNIPIKVTKVESVSTKKESGMNAMIEDIETNSVSGWGGNK